MDIDELVRRARPQDPTGWARNEQGRQVLAGVLSQPFDPARRGTDHTGMRRSAVRWSFVGTGLVGAAAAVALVLPGALATPQHDDRPAPPPAGGLGTSAAAVPGARDILLAAATRAEETPLRTGKYWHVRKEMVFGPIRVVRAPDPYYLLQRQVQETWVARGTGAERWQGLRSLGARPRTPDDEKAWRAAGSPSTWNQGPSDTADKHDLVLSAKPDKGMLVKAAPDNHAGSRTSENYSLDAVLRLPTDDARLRDRILRDVRTDSDFPPGSESENIRLFTALTQLLLDAPAPPKVRAAAFRVLADIPGVRSLGQVRDADGRPGLGVEMSSRTNGVVWAYQIVVDAGSHLLLAEKATSGRAGKALPIKEQSTLVYAAEWSDAKPRVPAVPGE